MIDSDKESKVVFVPMCVVIFLQFHEILIIRICSLFMYTTEKEPNFSPLKCFPIFTQKSLCNYDQKSILNFVPTEIEMLLHTHIRTPSVKR